MKPSTWGTLSTQELTAVASRMHSCRFRTGEVIFNDGDIGDAVYLVETGRLAVQIDSWTGHTITLRIVQPGEWCGELALVREDHRRSGRVTVLEPTVARVLRRRDFEELRREHGGIDRLLVDLLAERVIRTSQLVAEFMLSPEQRLWRRLAVLAEEYGDDPIRLSQDALAQTSGTVRQTVNRVLQIGVRHGALSVQRGEIRVIDRAALTRLVSEPPRALRSRAWS